MTRKPADRSTGGKSPGEIRPKAKKPVVIEGEAQEVPAESGSSSPSAQGQSSETAPNGKPKGEPAKAASVRDDGAGDEKPPSGASKGEASGRASASKAPSEGKRNPKPAGDGPPRGERTSAVAMLAALVLGGALAALIGFAMARYVVPEGWPFPGVKPQPDPLAVAQEAQGRELAALKTRVAELEQGMSALRAEAQKAAARLDALESAIPEINSRLDALEAQARAFDTRIQALEKMPIGASAEAAQKAAEAYQRELEAMRKMFAEELKRIEQEQKAAVAKTTKAEGMAARAAMAEIMAALDEGAPFAAALTTLEADTGLTPPEALVRVAKTGVPTLQQLKDSFPDHARAAIAASVRAAAEAGRISRFEAFLRTQLGARSLEPRKGDDADAVLSRAEAALRQGKLDQALKELDGLDPAARAAMQDWIDQARTRLAAMRAAQALAQQLNGG